jgi:hypothetical protein
MGTEADAAWLAQRGRAIEAHARAQEVRRAREAEQAAELISSFVRDAVARGLAPTALTALGHRGRVRYRTKLRGWYLDQGRSRAVDTEGRFFVLAVADSVRARLAGVDVEPRPAPLVVGEGGRDGESIPLRTLLQRRLDATE